MHQRTVANYALKALQVIGHFIQCCVQAGCAVSATDSARFKEKASPPDEFSTISEGDCYAVMAKWHYYLLHIDAPPDLNSNSGLPRFPLPGLLLSSRREGCGGCRGSGAE